MPCFIKKLTIESISGGVVNFGDSHCISPKNIESSTSGSGGGGNGDFQLVINGKSITNCSDPNNR
ncbi:spore germination protein [Bacillus sp. J37]|uniref:spore germination protein n=1 Tax=Bacillus sp. J37 TaxID=935837 RepID=UPI000478FC78|nr:spore germination protein [Bacillus sp. J37]